MGYINYRNPCNLSKWRQQLTMKYSVHNIIPTPEAQGTSRKKGVGRLARARGPRTKLPGMVIICARLG